MVGRAGSSSRVPLPLKVSSLVCLGLLACSAPQGTDVARSYVEALRSGRTAEAYAHLSMDQRARVSLQRFTERQTAMARAERLGGSVLAWSTEDGNLTLVQQDGRWVLEDVALEPDPREVLRGFIAAVEAKDFSWALRLLSKDWRAFYTPETLAKDFEREPLARLRVNRLRSAMSAPIRWSSTGAELPLAGENGPSVRLVLEDDSFRLAELE
jgi:hypothetical protein